MNGLNKFFALCLAGSTAMVAMEGAIAQYSETKPSDLSTTPISGAALLGPTQNSPWEWNVGMGGEYPDLSIKASSRNMVSFQTAFAPSSGQNTANIPTMFTTTNQWSVNSGNVPALYLRKQSPLLQIIFHF